MIIRRDNCEVHNNFRRPLLTAVLAALFVLALSLNFSCREDDGSRTVTVSPRPAWIPADGRSTLQLEISSDSVPPVLTPSLGRITGLHRLGGGRWRATLQSGTTTGRALFTAAGAQVREIEPAYFIPPPDPAYLPACTRDTLAGYTILLDRVTGTAILEAAPTGNLFASGVNVFLYPDVPPVFNGDTVTFAVMVEGTSVSTDLFDVRLTVDAVDSGALLSPGSTADGETFFDFGDFPDTFAAVSAEGAPALWVEFVEVRLNADQALVSGRVSASSPCPRPDAAFRIRPYLTRKEQDRISLRWETDREAPTFAAFGGPDCNRVAGGTLTRRRLYDDYDWSFPRRFNSFLHTVELGGLKRGDTVWYRVPPVAGSFGPEPFVFDTRPGRAFTFGAISDTQFDNVTHTRVAGLLALAGIDFYVHGGDLVEQAWRVGDWLNFFKAEAPAMRNALFFPTPGNHDQYDFDLFYNRFFSAGRWYSFDWGNSHFVFIDSFLDTAPGSPQYEWLSADLAATAARPEIRFTFLTMHNPIWTAFPSKRYYEGDQLEPLLESYRVDAVFSGHIHIYERSNVNGRVYINCSGGGGPIRNPPKDLLNPYFILSEPIYHYLTITVEADRFTVRAFNWNNQVFDQVTKLAE